MKNTRALMDPMAPTWRKQTSIAALERRRGIRMIAFVVMLHIAIFCGLLAPLFVTSARVTLTACCVGALLSIAWQLVCIIRANCRIADLKEDLR